MEDREIKLPGKPSAGQSIAATMRIGQERIEWLDHYYPQRRYLDEEESTVEALKKWMRNTIENIVWHVKNF